MTAFTELAANQVATLCAKHSVELRRVGASNVSESVYYEIRMPKEIDAEYGVMEWHVIDVRISEHTNTRACSDADLRVDIYDEAELHNALQDIESYIESAECIHTK